MNLSPRSEAEQRWNLIMGFVFVGLTVLWLAIDAVFAAGMSTAFAIAEFIEGVFSPRQ